MYTLFYHNGSSHTAGFAIMFRQSVRKVSDRIAVMREGSIIEEGPSNEIVAAPKDTYTRNLMNAASI